VEKTVDKCELSIADGDFAHSASDEDEDSLEGKLTDEVTSRLTLSHRCHQDPSAFAFDSDCLVGS